jgi:ferrous iron transport protein A
MEMGIVPGAFVSIQSVSPFGNPIAIRVANYTLSIRREDAGDVVLAEY